MGYFAGRYGNLWFMGGYAWRDGRDRLFGSFLSIYSQLDDTVQKGWVESRG